MKESGRKASEYNKGSLDSGTYRAKTYALPINPDYGVLIFPQRYCFTGRCGQTGKWRLYI